MIMLLPLKLAAQDVIVIVRTTVKAAIVVPMSPPTAVVPVAVKNAASVIETDAVMLIVVPIEKIRTVNANVIPNPASLCAATLVRVKRPDDETVETAKMDHQSLMALLLVPTPTPTPTKKMRAALVRLLQWEHRRPHHLHLPRRHCPLTTTHVAGALVGTVVIDLTTVTGNESAEVTVAVIVTTGRVAAAQAIASVDALTLKRMPVVVMGISVAHARATIISGPVVGSECHLVKFAREVM